MSKKDNQKDGQTGPFSGRDRERCGYIGNEFVVACRYCDTIHRQPAKMNRLALRGLKDHFERFDRCNGCARTLVDVEWRKLSPRNSELEEMEKASRWMKSDRGGKEPTCQELWTWLERNPVAPNDAVDLDQWGYDED